MCTKLTSALWMAASVTILCLTSPTGVLGRSTQWEPSGQAKKSWHQVSIGALDGKQTLPDGDKIKMTTAEGMIQKDRIGIAIRLDGLSWWKGVQAGPIVLGQVQDSQNYQSTTFSVSDLQKNGLQLWKAKTLGMHKNVYNIKEAPTTMLGGRSYLITWSKD